MRSTPSLASACAAIACALSLAPMVSLAQTTEPSNPRDPRAIQQLFRDATAAFDSVDDARALALFQRLYQLTEDPPVLVNIGRVLARMNRDADAITAWQRFLEQASAPAERAPVEALVREAQERERQRAAALQQMQSTRIQDTRPPPPRTRVVTERVGPGPAPWIVLGVGAAVAASAAIPFFAVRGPAIQELIDGRCDPNSATECPRSLEPAYNRAQAASAASIALLSIGSAAIVGGALWGLLGGRTEQRTVTVSGWIDPRGGGGFTLAFGGRR